MSKSIVSTRAIDTLANLGLNSYERKIYVTLIAKGVSSAGALSEQSTVPRSRCYDVLESLKEKGFVVLQNTKPIKYMAVEPKEALENLKKRQDFNYRETLDRIERTKNSDSLTELEQIFKNGIQSVPTAELSGSIKGHDSMNQHMESAIKRSKTSLSILTTSKGVENLSINHLKHLKGAAKDGVKVKIVAPINKDNETYAKELSRIAEVRHSQNQGRMIIADGNEVIVALTNDSTHPTEDIHFWSQSDHVSSQIASPMFDTVWKNAKRV